MKITVAEEHLDKAIEERNLRRKPLSHCCVLAQAILPQIPGSRSVACGAVYCGTTIKNEKISHLYPQTIWTEIEMEFDRHEYEKIRKRLPISFQVMTV